MHEMWLRKEYKLKKLVREAKLLSFYHVWLALIGCVLIFYELLTQGNPIIMVILTLLALFTSIISDLFYMFFKHRLWHVRYS